MRLALLIASSFDRAPTLPETAVFMDSARSVAARLRADDAAFSVHQLIADGDLPSRLNRALDKYEGLEDLFVYYAGYFGVTGEGRPALLLDGDETTSLTLQFVEQSLTPRARSVCFVMDGIVGSSLDGVAVADAPRAITTRAVEQWADSSRSSCLLAGNRWGSGPFEKGLPFTQELLHVIELLASSRTDNLRVTAAWIFDALQRRPVFGTLEAATGRLSPNDFCLFKASRELAQTAPGAVTPALPAPPAALPSIRTNLPAFDLAALPPAADARTSLVQTPASSLPAVAAPTLERSSIAAASVSAPADTLVLERTTAAFSQPEVPGSEWPGAETASEAGEVSRNGYGADEALPQAPLTDSVAPPAADTNPQLADEGQTTVSSGLDDELPTSPVPFTVPAAPGEPLASSETPDEHPRPAPAQPPAFPPVLPARTHSAPAGSGYSNHQVDPHADSPEVAAELLVENSSQDWSHPPTLVSDAPRPLSPSQLLSQARSALADEDLPTAIALLRQADEMARPELRSSILLELATALRRAGDREGALEQLEGAVELAPTEPEPFQQLVAELLRIEDRDRVDEVYAFRLSALPVEQLAGTYAAQVALWNEQLDDARALRAVQEWLTALGDSPEALLQLVQIAERTEDYPKEIDGLTRLAPLTQPAERAAAYLATAAERCSSRLLDQETALRLAYQALALNPEDEVAFRLLDALLRDQGCWVDLAGVYERVLEIQRDPQRVRELGIKVAQLYLHRVGYPLKAVTALERILRLRPDDVEVRCDLAELYEQQESWGEAAAQMRQAIEDSNCDPRTLRRARGLFERSRNEESLWQVASTLTIQGEATADDRRIVEAHRHPGLLAATQVMGPLEWGIGGLFPERDSAIDQILASFSHEDAISAKLAHLKKHKRLPNLNPELRQEPQSSTTTLARTLLWTARLLGVPVPGLFVESQLEPQMVLSRTVPPAAQVNRTLGSGLTLPQLAFLWGRELLFLRPEYSLLVYFPTASELHAVITAALAALELLDARHLDDESKYLFKKIKRKTNYEHRARLMETLAGRDMAYLASFESTSVWLTSLAYARGRIGLLCCGDLMTAHDLTQKHPWHASHAISDQLRDLCCFANSNTYQRLRHALGVTLSAMG